MPRPKDHDSSETQTRAREKLTGHPPDGMIFHFDSPNSLIAATSGGLDQPLIADIEKESEDGQSILCDRLRLGHYGISEEANAISLITTEATLEEYASRCRTTIGTSASGGHESIRAKAVFLGDTKSGKTSLINAILGEDVQNEHIATIGASYHRHL
jgi:hypothetical protein